MTSLDGFLRLLRRPSLGVLALLACCAAAADDGGTPPVYLGTVARGNQKPEVKFVLARPAGGGRFTLTQGFTVEPVAGPDGCEVRPTSDLRLPDRYFERPIYDPAEARSRLAAGDD